MQHEKTQHACTFDFSSWREFIEYTRDGRSPELSDADRMADAGWLEGAEIARRFYNEHMDVLGSLIERHDVEYDVAGNSIDVAKYVQAEPDCWMTFETRVVESQSPRFVRVVVNNLASGAVSNQTILARGAALAALVDLVELSGARCEVVVVGATVNGFRYSVLVKPFDEPLDLPLVAYAIGHPTSQRVHTFRLYDRIGEMYGSAWRTISYGVPADVPESVRGDLYIPCMRYDGHSVSQWSDPKTAQAWIIEQLRACGVALRETNTAGGTLWE